MNTPLFYLYLNDQQSGPYAIEQLRGMWSTGSLYADTLYWKEGMSNWMPVHTLLAPQGVNATDQGAHGEHVTNRFMTPHMNSFTVKRSLYVGLFVFFVVFLYMFVFQLIDDSLAKAFVGFVIIVGLILSTWFRLKDCGWPRTLAFFQLLPFVGIVFAIVLFFIPSKPTS